MKKTIYINVLLKDNKIMCYHISPNKRETPSDYYKDFFYANYNMKDCDKIFRVVGISVNFLNNENDESRKINNCIFKEMATSFFKQWEIHPNHFGSVPYIN